MQRPCTRDFYLILDQLYKLVKNLILIRISSNFPSNISTSICIRKRNKNGEFILNHFWQNMANNPVLLYTEFGHIFEQIKKFIKNPILIGISSNYLHNISTCICIRKCNKNGEFFLTIFGKIWPTTLYYSTMYMQGLLPYFGANL